MVGKPCGPWRRLNADGSDVEPPSLGEFQAAPHLYRYAHLYREVGIKMLQKGLPPITPDVVDSWESWQAAAFLGLGLPEEATGPDGMPARPTRDIAMEHAEYLLAQQQGREVAPPRPDAPQPPSADPRFLKAVVAPPGGEVR